MSLLLLAALPAALGVVVGPAAAEGLGDSRVLVIDGVDDYASAPDGAAFDLGMGADSDFTLETMFKAPTDQTFKIADVFQKPWAYFAQFIFNVNGSALDRMTWRVQIDHDHLVDLIVQRDLSPGWHHLAVTFDNEIGSGADVMAMYLDGARVGLSAEGVWTGGVPDTDNAFSVGGYQGSYSFPGMFEETRISDTVRYTGATYAVPTEAFTTDAHTVALWHFDEAAGATSFADASGNGNTLTGANGAATGVEDTTPPQPPMLDQPSTPTNLRKVDLSGMTELDSVVTVYEGDELLGTATTYDDGGFAAQVTLPPGKHVLTAKATDVAGNVSEASGAVTVVVDTGRPSAVAINNVRVKKGKQATLKYRVDDPAPSCGRASVTLTIRRKAKVVKVITVGNVAVGKLRTRTFTVWLSRGSYTWTAKATDAAYNTGKTSPTRSFVVT